MDKVINVFNLKINENLKYSDQVIESDFFDPERRIYSKLYSFIGNSPSNIQFYLTNKIDKFLTGSLFFETKPNYDSLYPNINYIKNDIKKMVSSFKWVDE
jgi:gliding motility-associated lipoprotein GldD